MTVIAAQIAVPDGAVVAGKTDAAVKEAQALAVIDQATYTLAAERLKGLAGLEKEIVATFEESKALAFKTHKAISAAEKKHLEPVQQARKLYGDKMAAWYKVEDEKRQKEQQRLNEEARQREETERLERASKLEAQGKPLQAAKVLEKPRAVAKVQLDAPAAVAGVAMVTRWDAEVVDIMALAAAVGRGDVAGDALQANQVFLRAQSQAYKNKETFAAKFPGCVATSETKPAVRS
jgi:hypothetical protein